MRTEHSIPGVLSEDGIIWKRVLVIVFQIFLCTIMLISKKVSEENVDAIFPQ
jgi:hypothetical protein